MADSSKKMSLMGLTTIVAVNMMGSGIIMLPANMAQLGAVSLLSKNSRYDAIMRMHLAPEERALVRGWL